MNLGIRRVTSGLMSLGLICIVLLGCVSAADGGTKPRISPTARLDRPFTLRAGRMIALQGQRLRIKFAEVTSDSRCPVKVKCVWAGNAAVRLEVTTNGRSEESLTLNTGTGPAFVSEATYEGFKVKLVDLSPTRRGDRQVAPGDYVVTLVVSKAASKVMGSESSDASADTKSSRDREREELILELEKEGRDATLRNDVEGNDRLLADNWMNINPDGSVTTKAQLMELLKAGTFKISSIENDEVLVRVYRGTAIVTGRSTTRRAGQGDEIISRQVRFTRVYARPHGRWQVVSAHNSLIR